MLLLNITQVFSTRILYWCYFYRNHRGLSETLRSRLDSNQTSLVKRSRPGAHKIVISNLEPSVTSEDIRVSIEYYLKMY